MRKKVFVTGGHFTPAKRVVDELLKSGEWEIYYVGRKNSLEGDKAVSLEYQEMAHRPSVHFLEIITGRPQRRFTSNTIPSLLKIPLGFLMSFYWLLRFRPAVIMSFGGYVAIPVATVAKLFGIPIAHHEQIATFGAPSKYLAQLANEVMVSFPELVPKQFNNKWVYTGNPLREEIFTVTPSENLAKFSALKKKLKLPVLYLTGGNQGAHRLNEALLSSLQSILKNYLLIWQTGDSQEFRDFDAVEKAISELAPELKDRLVVQKFFLGNEIGAVFNLADIVISRGGANTIFELATLAKPAIIIPIPWVHDGEQLKNAQMLEKYQAARILLQDDLTPGRLMSEIKEVAVNYSLYKKGAQSVKASLPADPAKLIVATLSKLTL